MGQESPAGLEAQMDAAWPAAEQEESGGWVLRAASGVTQRANSVWPRELGVDTHAQLAALRHARLWYRARRLPLIFQVFDDPRSAPLNAVLDAEGFTRQSETLVMARTSGGAAPADCGVEISAEPSPEWLRLWWSVDGRGDETAMDVARGILTGCPSLYALVRDDGGVPAAVGRLALPVADLGGPRWGGLYCMATRPDARRRGYGDAPGPCRVLAARHGGQHRGAGTLRPRRLRGVRPVSVPAGAAQAAPDRLLTGSSAAPFRRFPAP